MSETRRTDRIVPHRSKINGRWYNTKLTIKVVPLSEKKFHMIHRGLKNDYAYWEADVLLAVEGFKKEMAGKPFRSFGDIKRGLERWFG